MLLQKQLVSSYQLLVGQQCMEHGEEESKRLPRSSLCLDGHIVVLHEHGKGALLNGHHVLKTQNLLQAGEELGVKFRLQRIP